MEFAYLFDFMNSLTWFEKYVNNFIRWFLVSGVYELEMITYRSNQNDVVVPLWLYPCIQSRDVQSRDVLVNMLLYK